MTGAQAAVPIETVKVSAAATLSLCLSLSLSLSLYVSLNEPYHNTLAGVGGQTTTAGAFSQCALSAYSFLGKRKCRHKRGLTMRRRAVGALALQ